MPAPKARFVRPQPWLGRFDKEDLRPAYKEVLQFKADWVADSQRYGALADFHEFNQSQGHHKSHQRQEQEKQDRGKIVQTLMLNRAFGRNLDAVRPAPILAASVTPQEPAQPEPAPEPQEPAQPEPTEGVDIVSLSEDEDVDVESDATEAGAAAEATDQRQEHDASVPEHAPSIAFARAMRRWPKRRLPKPWGHRRRTKKASSAASAQNKRPQPLRRTKDSVPLAARFNRCSPSIEAARGQNTKHPVSERDRSALARIRALARWPPEKQKRCYIKLAAKKSAIDARKNLIRQKFAERQRAEHERTLNEPEVALRAPYRCHSSAPWHCTPFKCNPIYEVERQQ